MGVLARIAAAFRTPAPEPVAEPVPTSRPRPQPRQAPRPIDWERAFEAARTTRLQAAWTTHGASINTELYHELPALRARSRDLWSNNEYMKSFVKGLKSDVVGSNGFRLQMRVMMPADERRARCKSEIGRLERHIEAIRAEERVRPIRPGVDERQASSTAILAKRCSTLRNEVRHLRQLGATPVQDTRTNETIELHWADWRRVGNYDTTGKLSGVDGEKLFIETVARDGEALIRIWRDFDNPFGYAVQFIDPERLDIRRNEVNSATGNRIIMGVELDDADRAVAYHILRHHPDVSIVSANYSREADRIPSEDVIHAFIVHRAEQLRGIPWAHASMLSLYDVGGYREAAIVASRVGASQLGWWRTPDADSGPYDDIEDQTGQKYVDAEPGEFGQIGVDDELVKWDPSYPHDQFGAFNQAVLQGVSAGLDGTTYHGLTGDLTGVNFTSGRLGNMRSQDELKAIQTWTQGVFLDVVFPDWLRFQLFTGRLELPGVSVDRLENRQRWQPKRWAHVQPREQAGADALYYGLRAKSLSQIAAEMGTDIEETHAQIERELNWLRERDIEPTIPTTLQAEPSAAEDASA